MRNRIQFLPLAFLFMITGMAGCSDDDTDSIIPESKIMKTAVKFAVPDFKESFVYLVKDARSTLAEICQEYIPAFSEEKRATVVYPFDREGKVDHALGFVVDNGGSVSWQEDGTCVYKAGAEQPVTTLYVDSCRIMLSGDAGKNGMVQPDLLKDIDGNFYRIVKIGMQYWSADNFRCMHYVDGSSIVTDLDDEAWAANTSGAYTMYKFSEWDEIPEGLDVPENIVAGYGLLYNWYAASSRSLAPKGWALPSAGEMEKLKAYLDNGKPEGESVAGGMMKEVGLVHWRDAINWDDEGNEISLGNVGATNISGFSAVGSSLYFGYSYYARIQTCFDMWTSDVLIDEWGNRWVYYELSNSDALLSNFGADAIEGRAVRFIKK